MKLPTPTQSNVCDVCGKTRGAGSNHSACAKIRQQRFANENKTRKEGGKKCTEFK